MNEFTFKVDKKSNGYLAQDFLLKVGVSKEIIKKIKVGGVFLNGKALSFIKTPVKYKDEIKIVLNEPSACPFVLPVKKEITVLYEDEYLIAVDKPSGVLTHNSKNNKTLSLDSMLLGYFYPKPFVFRAITRLDRDTSGVTLIAKDEFTASLLSENMKKGDFKKTYYAVVVGSPIKTRFTVEKPIKRASETGMKRVCALDGQYAKTDFSLVKRLDGGLSLIKARLYTGRTHQIRVHLSSVNLPLYADALYGTAIENQTFILNAKVLEFTHPHTKKRIKIKSKIKI